VSELDSEGTDVFCPQCGAEYRPGVVKCADCAVPLVPAPIESKPSLHEPKTELVTVLETGDPALIDLAESLLDEAEIEFMTKGEGEQDLLGWGGSPSSRDLAMGADRSLILEPVPPGAGHQQPRA